MRPASEDASFFGRHLSSARKGEPQGKSSNTRSISRCEIKRPLEARGILPTTNP
jgi:hypothetical protein